MIKLFTFFNLILTITNIRIPNHCNAMIFSTAYGTHPFTKCGYAQAKLARTDIN